MAYLVESASMPLLALLALLTPLSSLAPAAFWPCTVAAGGRHSQGVTELVDV